MNQMTRHTQRFLALLLVGASLYLTGCGPENLDDAAYFADFNDNDNGMVVDGAEKNAVMPKPTMKNQHGGADRFGRNMNGHHMRGHHMRGGMNGGNGFGQNGAYGPNGGYGQNGAIGGPGVQGVAGPAVAGVVNVGEEFADLPPMITPQPLVATNTAELRPFNRRINIEQKRFIPQPMENNHLITNNLNTERVFHRTDILQPNL